MPPPSLNWFQRLRRTAFLAQAVVEGHVTPTPSQSLWDHAIAAGDTALVAKLKAHQIVPMLAGHPNLDDTLHKVLRHHIQTKTVPGQGVLPRNALMDALLALGANPSPSGVSPEKGSSVTSWAVEQGDLSLTKILLNHGVDFAQPSDQPGWPLLLRVLAAGREPGNWSTMQRWDIVNAAIKAGTSPLLTGPTGESLLTFAIDDRPQRVDEVLTHMNRAARDHMEQDPRHPWPIFAINLAEWVGRAHPEYEYRKRVDLLWEDRPFPLVAILNQLWRSCLLADRDEMFTPRKGNPAHRDSQGRSVFQAWLAKGPLTQETWDAFMDEENRHWWLQWNSQDNAGNTLLHTVLSRADLWNPQKTAPALAQTIFNTVLENAPRRYRTHSGGPILEAPPLSRLNASGLTPIQVFREESKTWPPNTVLRPMSLLRDLATSRDLPERPSPLAELGQPPRQRQRP